MLRIREKPIDHASFANNVHIQLLFFLTKKSDFLHRKSPLQYCDIFYNLISQPNEKLIPAGIL